jgi:hypothetical protein
VGKATARGRCILDLNERENKFLKMIYDQTGGDVSQLFMEGELYPLAKKMGFNEHEVGSISAMLRGLGLLEIDTHKGEIEGKPASIVAYVKITSPGVLYARRA